MKKSRTLYFFLSEQENNYVFAPCDVFLNLKNPFSNLNKISGIKRKQTFGFSQAKSINFIGLTTDQFISLGTGIVPFLEHNDANRVLMGSNMQRQSLSLLDREMSFSETGRECSIVRESEATTVARKSGKVIYSSINKIVIKEVCRYTKFCIQNTFIKNVIMDKSFNDEIIFKKMNNSTITYFLGTSKKSNHNVFLRKNPIVKKGDWVKAGQVIADNRGTLRGNLSFGKNILIGYMGWEGYNFEDAVIINERLITEDIFTSLHVKKYKTFFIVGGKKEV